MHPLVAWTRPLAVAAGYAAAFVLVRRAAPFELTSPGFVFVAMICFLGLTFSAQPAVMLRMPGPLRSVREWERDGGLYRAIAVPAYGRLLRRTPLRLFNRDVYLRNGLGDAARVFAELEAAEASHFWDAMLVLPYMVHLASQGAWATFLWFTLAQVLVNLYPVLHLRQARLRFHGIISRRQRRRGGTA
jgi:hypothetical protein